MEEVGVVRDGIVVFSGGSAANAISDVFETLGKECGSAVTYLIGVSDNGGSTSEIIRMIGGPGIGDIRSRLVRLIPEPKNGGRIRTQKAQENIRDMMSLRLDQLDQDLAAHEFEQLCAGAHELWLHVESERKELIRNIFITMQAEILKRTRYPSSRFNFCNASVGNLFLTGARLFTGSLESAIWLMRKACNIPDEVAEVWPVISRNFTSHIAAELENGDVIIGQNDISHPSKEDEETKSLLYTEDFYAPEDEREDANWPGSHKRLKGGDIVFDKNNDKQLDSRIERVFYVNPYGHEVRHRASQKVVDALDSARVVVYSIGSFWTSLIPTVLPHPTPGLLSLPSILAKIFLLNNSLDREVSPHEPTPYRASTFLIQLAKQLHYCLPLTHSQSRDNVDFTPELHVKLFVTHVFVMDEVEWHRDEQDCEALRRLGVKRVVIKGVEDGKGGWGYDLRGLEGALRGIYEEELKIV
ncbi:hypothetical protein BJ508DRAFT_214594 [Ascobolus immersus RN42]|uniref:Uncharacterized protein n=1 Tax=Ascobolus immersus RN42 TaxID=1160509 RepID=A0A3N4HNL2_ASCIM|nr:hypothetical protein BJ508DRAFT_214594 [Ascobolus immersus RN42]